jgi:hypothetical protein
LGQARTVSQASSSSHNGTAWWLTIGKPQSSGVISSGNASAHRPRPSHAMKSTLSRGPTSPVLAVTGPSRWNRKDAGVPAAPAGGVLVQLGTEGPQGAADQAHGAAGMGTAAAAVDLAEPAP